MPNKIQANYLSVRNQTAEILFNRLSVNYYHIDLNGILLDCNERVLTLFCTEPSVTLLGKPVSDFIAPGAWQNCLRVMHENKSMTVEEIHRMEDGTQIIYLSIKEPVYDETGAVSGLVGISIDITERKQAEIREKVALADLAEKNARLSSAELELRRATTVLAGSIAHDLRTPLSSTILLTDLFNQKLSGLKKIFSSLALSEEERSPLSLSLEQLAEYPQKIKKTMYGMSDFIDITLKLIKRLVTGTLSHEDFIVCDVLSCLEEPLRAYPFEGDEPELVDYSGVEPFTFMGIPVLFYCIVHNLLANALAQIKEKKRGKISIFTHTHNEMNELHFKDTAGGISAEIMTHLFDEYNTTKKEGTGVGLAFCKLTMKNFNGEITCRSIEGEFIEFILSFPKIMSVDDVYTFHP